jgi:hypothetical protein
MWFGTDRRLAQKTWQGDVERIQLPYPELRALLTMLSPEITYPTWPTRNIQSLSIMSRSLLNIAKRSLPRLMLSGVGLASKDAAG